MRGLFYLNYTTYERNHTPGTVYFIINMKWIFCLISLSLFQWNERNEVGSENKGKRNKHKIHTK